MHVGLITYAIGHKKTWQIMNRLISRRISVTIYAFPFKKRLSNIQEQSIFSDRPSQILEYDVEKFCSKYNIGYRKILGWTSNFSKDLKCNLLKKEPQIFLHCTAKIIPEYFINNRTILNCHPGLLPQNRGVDSLKWAVVKKWPMGVTLHIIDKEIDRGTILNRVRIPIFDNDTLKSICKRMYEFEINLLSNFDCYLAQRVNNWHVDDSYPCSHERISKNEDNKIEQIFLSNRSELIKASNNKKIHYHESEI